MTHAEKAALRKRKNLKSGMIESNSPVSILVDVIIDWACTQSAYGLFFWQYRERINHFTCSVTLREFWLQ